MPKLRVIHTKILPFVTSMIEKDTERNENTEKMFRYGLDFSLIYARIIIWKMATRANP